MRAFFFLLLFCLAPLCLWAGEISLQDLQDARLAGDYVRADELMSRLEPRVLAMTDPLLRVRSLRILYTDTIDLPDNVFFDKTISVMTADGDDLWLGSRSGDAARYSLSERQWRSYTLGQESLAIRTLQKILPEGERIWFLSYGSVGLYSRRLDRLVSLDIPDAAEYRGLQSAVIVGDGLIAGTQGSGLRRIRLDSQSVLPVSSGLRNITFLQSLSRGRIFAGTESSGSYILDSRYTARSAGRNASQLSALRVLLGDEGTQMIAGSYGGGLFKLVRRGEGYDIVLLNDQARWITGGVETPDFYCFSTLGRGLAVLDKKTLSLRTYGIKEGLGGLDFTAIAYEPPYILAALQGQKLVKVHEDFFRIEP